LHFDNAVFYLESKKVVSSLNMRRLNSICILYEQDLVIVSFSGCKISKLHLYFQAKTFSDP